MVQSAALSGVIGRVEDIPLGEGREYRLGEETIAVFRTRTGAVHAVQARCPHRDGPLADGLVGAGRVVCPLHGHAFELATGASARPDCAALRTYPVTVNERGELVLTGSA